MIPSIQSIFMSGLLSLALLLTACQPASEPAPLPPQETTISQAATVALPTALPTRTNTPFPTDTPSPSATPTLARTSQGDQLPTRSPTSPATSTAIPAEEPVPSTIATRPLLTPTLAPVNEVDLPALEESLVLLDRLERRKGKPTPTPIRPIIYEGGVVSYVEKACLPCEGCDKQILRAEIFTRVDRTITGTINSVIGPRPILFAGTADSITNAPYDLTFDDGKCNNQNIIKLQAELVDGGQRFKGTIDHTLITTCSEPRVVFECEGVYTFSLDRK